MPADAFEMAVVHRVFRRELSSAPALVSNVRPSQRARRQLVARHITDVLTALHNHHVAEDRRLWPKLYARVPTRDDDIRRMETEHEFIAKAVIGVESRLADWITTSEAPNIRGDNRSCAVKVLVAELGALAELVSDHLGAEEELMVPLINANLTEAEWRAVARRGGTFIGRNVWSVLAFQGMALEGCTADERRRFLAGMPQPDRLLAKLFARRALAKYRARLEGQS